MACSAVESKSKTRTTPSSTTLSNAKSLSLVRGASRQPSLWALKPDLNELPIGREWGMMHTIVENPQNKSPRPKQNRGDSHKEDSSPIAALPSLESRSNSPTTPTDILSIASPPSAALLLQQPPPSATQRQLEVRRQSLQSIVTGTQSAAKRRSDNKKQATIVRENNNNKKALALRKVDSQFQIQHAATDAGMLEKIHSEKHIWSMRKALDYGQYELVILLARRMLLNPPTSSSNAHHQPTKASARGQADHRTLYYEALSAASTAFERMQFCTRAILMLRRMLQLRTELDADQLNGSNSTYMTRTELTEHHRKIQHRLAECYFQRGIRASAAAANTKNDAGLQVDLALADFTRARKLWPENKAFLTMHINTLVDKQRVDEAVQLILTEIARSEQSGGHYKSLTPSLIEDDDESRRSTSVVLASANADFSPMAITDTNTGELVVLLKFLQAKIFYMKGDVKSALERLREAGDLQKQLSQQQQTDANEGRTSASVQNESTAMLDEIKQRGAQEFEHAIQLILLSRYEDALKIVSNAMTYDPQDVRFPYYRSVCLRFCGKYDEAVQQLSMTEGLIQQRFDELEDEATRKKNREQQQKLRMDLVSLRSACKTQAVLALHDAAIHYADKISDDLMRKSGVRLRKTSSSARNTWKKVFSYMDRALELNDRLDEPIQEVRLSEPVLHWRVGNEKVAFANFQLLASEQEAAALGGDGGEIKHDEAVCAMERLHFVGRLADEMRSHFATMCAHLGALSSDVKQSERRQLQQRLLKRHKWRQRRFMAKTRLRLRGYPPRQLRFADT